MRQYRTDLIIEAEHMETGSLSGGKLFPSGVGGQLEGVMVSENWNEDKTMKVTLVQIENEAGEKAMGRPIGKYITIELPELLSEEDTLKETAEEELEKQLRLLLEGKNANHILIVGLGNREVTADAVGPLTIDSLFVTGHYFQEENIRKFV